MLFLLNAFLLVGDIDREPHPVKFMLWRLMTGAGSGKEFINSPAAKDRRVICCAKALILSKKGKKKKDPPCARESHIYL